MDPQDFTEEEWGKALHYNIVEKNPELFEDDDNKALLIELTNLQRRFSKDYFNLLNLIKGHEEVVKLFYSYMDWYPDLITKWAPLNKEAEDHGTRRYLDDVVGTNIGAVAKDYDPRNADVVQAVMLIKDYIDSAKEANDDIKSPYKTLPAPPSDDLLTCACMMADPKHELKDQYDGTIIQTALEEIFSRSELEGFNRMYSKKYNKGKDNAYPYPSDITYGIKKTVKLAIKSLKKRDLV